MTKSVFPGFCRSLCLLCCSLSLIGTALPVFAQDSENKPKTELEIDLKDAEQQDCEVEDCEGSDESEDEQTAEQEADVCLFACEEDFPLDLNMLFHTGYSRYDLSSLNQVMQAKGYTPFSEHMFALGGSLQFVTWNFITEFEGNVAIGAPTLNDTYFSNLFAGNVLLNFGYQFKPLKALRIYPIVGVGLGFAQLDFTRRNFLPSFDEFLSNPGRQGQINNLLFTLNAGLGIDWVWDWGGQIGLRGGYLWTPPSNWWDIQDVRGDDSSRNLPVAGGPSMSLSGPYLRLMIGF